MMKLVEKSAGLGQLNTTDAGRVLSEGHGPLKCMCC